MNEDVRDIAAEKVERSIGNLSTIPNELLDDDTAERLREYRDGLREIAEDLRGAE